MVENESQYDVVLKMVLWGEGREAIFHRLKVNGIEGDRAQGIYGKARSERMRILRGEGFKVLLLGLVSLGAAAGIFSFFRLAEFNVGEFGEGVNGLPMISCFLGLVVALFGFLGLWKTTQGSFEILFASSKKGSIGES